MNKDTSYNNWSILCKNRTLCTAGGGLMFWSGAVNALTSYSVLSMRTTHLTGPATDQGKYLLSSPMQALFITLIIVAFVSGAYCATKAKRWLTLTQALLAPALLLFMAGSIMYFKHTDNLQLPVEISRILFSILLPFATGWQNGVTSQGGIGRTTHLTGDLTDLGIALAGGNLDRAAYLFIKYLGFVIGAAVGYLGSQTAPALSLLSFSVGYAVTILVFHYMDARVAKPVSETSLQYFGMVRE